MLQWLQVHQTALVWTAIGSVAMFLASIFLVPAIIVRIPADYFAHDKRPRSAWADRHPVMVIAHRIGKNVLGCIFIITGVAMLVLPGQGLLTILIGGFLLDFPGKYRVEKWIMAKRPVLSAMNWLRKRANRPPLIAAANNPKS